MRDIFFREKSKGLLLDLSGSGKKNISEIAKGIDCTYAHTFNLVKEMEKQDILRSKKDGRAKLISLTKRGNELADVMQSFEALLKSKKTKPQARKTRARKAKPKASTSTSRLQGYVASVEALFKSTKAKRMSAKEKAKKARLAGRYRALIHKLRPKDDESKALKTKALAQ